MSAKARMLSWLGDWILRELAVSAVEVHGDFRLVALQGELPGLGAGDKLQVLAGEGEVRTWTPIPTPDGALLLVYVRAAQTPGMTWIRGLKVGDSVRFIGPQRSIRPPEGPRVLVGDETSVAVAAALAAMGDTRVVLELGSPEGARAALARVGLSGATVLPRPAAPGAVLAAVQAAGEGRALVLTGGAPLVQRSRDALRAAGISPKAMKTYWVPGRAGLD